ncbi:hypothetical protein FKP32DRAFT_1677210 [Trametes sanguinea]|nr:hypothetical protein FKP32DRAFT_1677210 [Trametes sanguinea]
MPEYAEILGNVYTVNRWLRALRDCTGSLILKAIWTDATEPEMQKARPKTSRCARGLVYPMDSTSKIMRGSSGAQKPLWPHRNSQPLPNLDGLELRQVKATPRTMIFDLGTIYLQMQLHIHMVSQVYTRQQWDSEIAQVRSEVRKFRVGIALDFGDWVVALLTADNVFTPHWVSPECKLPIYHPDVYLEYGAFLDYMAKCMRGSGLLPRAQGPASAGGYRGSASVSSETLAINWVRTNVGGVGVYMSEEIFFVAGLSPFLSLTEFFRCPSRVARFCEAFWTLAHRAHMQIGSVPSAVMGYILAPTAEQRIRYTRWLYVHAKKQVLVSSRMKTLWSDYLTVLDRPHEDTVVRSLRDADVGLHDVFEPTFLAAAWSEKQIQLDHLVFGTSPLEDQPLDPLTAYYQACGLLGAQTNLRPSLYEPDRFLAPDQMRVARLNTNLYQCDMVSQKPIWTILAPFPCALVADETRLHGNACLPKRRVFYAASEQVRHAQSFENIVYNTLTVAIGPLEYCATGIRISRGGAGRSTAILAICRDSPALPGTFRQRLNISLKRMQDGRHKGGKRNKAQEKAAASGGWHVKARTSRTDEVQGLGNSGVHHDQEDSRSPGPRPFAVSSGASSPLIRPMAKKRRLNADRQLALLGAEADLCLPPKRRRLRGEQTPENPSYTM